MKSPLYCSITAALISISLSHGATLYTNGTLGDHSAGAFASDPDAGAWQASKFTISTGVSINSLIVDGFNSFPGPTDSFNLVIMADGSLPGAVVASVNGVPSTRTSSGGSYYEFTLALASPVVLDAGTYWLSVANADNTGDTWAWAVSAGAGQAAQSITSQTSGYSTNGTKLFAYSLEGTVVPEPSALLLGSIGICFLGRRRRA